MNEHRWTDWIKIDPNTCFCEPGVEIVEKKKKRTKNKTTKYAQTGMAAVAEAAPAVFSSVSLTRMPPVQVLPELIHH